MRFAGGIFDIDGVVLDTPHERAWREALDQLMAGSWHDLASQTTYAPGGFTSQVYQEQVAGKPRDAGAAAALAYFGIPDPDGARTRQYAERKQQILEQLAAAGDFHAYDDAVIFVLRVKAAGIRICAASSSKNADGFLRAVSVADFAARYNLQYPFVEQRTTLLDLFDADVDGSDVPHGKPAPDLYLAAARALRLETTQCFVVEDAPAGIAAAKAGGMYGIGVARHADAADLRASGADLVVERLDTLDAALAESGPGGTAAPSTAGSQPGDPRAAAPTDLRIAPPQRAEHQTGDASQETERTHALLWARGDAAWNFIASGYDPAREGQVEAELAIANGFIGTRASLEFPTVVSRPRTYIAGLFGQPPGPIISRVLLSAPDWPRLYVLVDGETLGPTGGTILSEERTLDARHAILHHTLRWRSPGGAVLRLRTARLASQAHRALAVQYAQIEVEQPATLSLEVRHHEEPPLPLQLVVDDDAEATDVWRTTQGRHWLAIAHDAALQVAGQALRPMFTAHGQCWEWQAQPGQQALFTRFVIHSRGDDGDEAAAIADSRADATATRQEILQRGTAGSSRIISAAWERRWAESDIAITGDANCQCAVRFAAYHLLARRQPRRSPRLRRRARAHRRRLLRPCFLGYRHLPDAVLHLHMARGGARDAGLSASHPRGSAR